MATELSESIALMLAERAAARAADWQARRDSKTAFRAERKKARDAGLKTRYRLKAARSQPKPSIT